MARLSRHEYFIGIAEAAAMRATCDRARVGCVLVLSDHIIATAYNGAPPGLPHCDDIGHDMQEGHCVRTTHSEENAVIQAALHGVSTRGAICYCTTQPCARCTRQLWTAGVRFIIFKDIYRSLEPEDARRIAEFEARGLVIKSLNEVRV